MLTSGRDLMLSVSPQLGHEPHLPAPPRTTVSHALRTRNAAARHEIKMAIAFSITLSIVIDYPTSRIPTWYVIKAPKYASAVM